MKQRNISTLKYMDCGSTRYSVIEDLIMFVSVCMIGPLATLYETTERTDIAIMF
jgi:hypothetical protein